ncbi:30S ribosomal protein S8 [Patescibacteria group bacterium]|nr:30S ribosomal protein S8 [Patescibacteria group bacterium]
MSLDRLSNMLSALKNASMAKKPYVELAHTNQCESVAKVLKNSGFLSEVKVFKDKGASFKNLRLELAKEDDTSFKVTQVKRISKPGRRLYRAYADLRPVAGGIGVAVVSTSRGIMSGSEARKKKLGGEIICEVY